MGSSYRTADLLIIVLLLIPSAAVMADGTIPYLEKVCEEVNCGKGTCKADIGYPFGFVCECVSGWLRTREDDDGLTFLPCVIPNCTLNYGCQPALPPVPDKPAPYNSSFFDPCYWVYCGEGKCKKNKTYTHTCECNPGYNNLLNISAFPCYSDCNIGSDCANLGINVANVNSHNGKGQGSGQGNSILPGKFQWVAISIFAVGMHQLWK